MFAIIKTGGKQFRVQNGDVIFVEKLNAAEGETVNFDVLMLENDGEVKVTLKPGVYAFCLDRGDSSIGKLVIVSEDYSDVPEIKLK